VYIIYAQACFNPFCSLDGFRNDDEWLLREGPEARLADLPPFTQSYHYGAGSVVEMTPDFLP